MERGNTKISPKKHFHFHFWKRKIFLKKHFHGWLRRVI